MAEPHPGKRPAVAAAIAAAIIVAAALLAWPVIGQQSRTEPQVPASETDAPPPPRSLLPDSFEARSAMANASPAPAGADTAAAPATPGQPPLIAAPINITPVSDPFASAAVSGRGIGVFGPLTLAAGGYGPATFTGSNGAFLAGLNRRMNAPIGSRWVAITLRRALLSESAAPAGIIPGDWVASRAMLLVRIGEYKPGSDKNADFALKYIDRVNQFLRQSVNEKATFEDTLKRLKTLFT